MNESWYSMDLEPFQRHRFGYEENRVTKVKYHDYEAYRLEIVDQQCFVSNWKKLKNVVDKLVAVKIKAEEERIGLYYRGDYMKKSMDEVIAAHASDDIPFPYFELDADAAGHR